MKVFILMVLVFCNHLLANSKKKIIIEWKKVATAEKYILEIRNSQNQIIYKKASVLNQQEIELELGNYEKKIYVVNKLDEIESESDWEPLKITPAKTPELLREEKILVSNEKKEILLEGKNFHTEMKIKLRKGEKIYILEKSQVTSSESAILVVDPELPEGEYDLVLENPKKSRVYPNLFQKESIARQVDEIQSPSKLKKWEIVKRSAALSGWGEYYAGNIFENNHYDIRGKFYFGSFIAFTLLYLYFNEFVILPSSKTPTQKKFEEDTTRNFATAFLMPNLSNNSRRIAALYGLNEMNKQANLVNIQSQRVNLMLFLMLGVYFTQLVDAFFIEKKENLTWDSQLPSFQISFSNHERNHTSFQIQWVLRF